MESKIISTPCNSELTNDHPRKTNVDSNESCVKTVSKKKDLHSLVTKVDPLPKPGHLLTDKQLKNRSDMLNYEQGQNSGDEDDKIK